MKKLIALALLTAGAVQAQTTVTVTLMAAGGLGALHQYHDVPTDAIPVDPVTMYLPQAGAGGVELWFQSEEGDPYNPASDNWHWTGVYAGSGGASTLQRYFCSGPLIDRGGYYSQDCSPTGELMTLVIYESVRTVRGSGSGRGGYATHRVWTLSGGTITFN